MQKRSTFWMPLAAILVTSGCAVAPAVTTMSAAGTAAVSDVPATPTARGFGLLSMQAGPIKLCEPRCSSQLSKWFPACQLVDGKPSTAWAPALRDPKPCLTFELPSRTQIKNVKVKASCRMTCEVDVLRKGGKWENVLSGLKPTPGQLCCFELPPTCQAESLRIRFCGQVRPDMRVCEVEICGTPIPCTPTILALN